MRCDVCREDLVGIMEPPFLENDDKVCMRPPEGIQGCTRSDMEGDYDVKIGSVEFSVHLRDHHLGREGLGYTKSQ